MMHLLNPKCPITMSILWVLLLVIYSLSVPAWSTSVILAILLLNFHLYRNQAATKSNQTFTTK